VVSVGCYRVRALGRVRAEPDLAELSDEQLSEHRVDPQTPMDLDLDLREVGKGIRSFLEGQLCRVSLPIEPIARLVATRG